jgi:pentatricopeptide repeat protein
MCANDTVTWNAVIAGCAKYSDYNRALQCFSKMKSECEMDDATYIGLLSACGHQGCVEEGFSHFSTMECHDIDPTIDHYNCLVDILGRSGRLNEAMSLLESVPFQVNIAGWTSLLDHCKSHGNRALAQKCYDYLASCDPRYSSSYALMSSIPPT